MPGLNRQTSECHHDWTGAFLVSHREVRSGDAATEGQLVAGDSSGGTSPGETPEQALQRHRRSAHVFVAELSVSLEQCQPWRLGERRGVGVRGCGVFAA